MVFSSLIFIFGFLPITLGLYYLSPRPLRNLIILVSSLVFYAWGEPVYIVIMCFTIIFNYITSRLISSYRDHKLLSIMFLIASLAVDLGILSFFKYAGFLAENLNALLGLNIIVTNLPLPLGISFYTFQTISYIIDVYTGKTRVEKNFITFGTYMTMFPHLVAGPIVRYTDVAIQLVNRKESLVVFGQGVELFLIGLGKKVLLANNIGLLWDSVKYLPGSELSVLTAWLGIIAFTFQIYFDFSGYTDMALGLAKMFGLKLKKNFDYPYISTSITEFWRRWHISLGSWFREYLYIPLGGNRAGQLKQYRNILIVWFLTGLWHGASWNFILWGLYFGLWVTLEKIFLLAWLEKRRSWIRHLYTMLIVIFGWVLFEYTDLSQAGQFLIAMFGLSGNALIDTRAIYYLYTNAWLLLLLTICSTPLLRKFNQWWANSAGKWRSALLPAFYLLLTLVCISYLVNASYNPFLYFRF